MKGYYQIKIRRAATGATRVYNFLNHIMPDFYEILLAKSVNDNSNSVIDTLVFGDGVGSHSTDATVLNGSIVYEKKYNSYQPPINLSATTASTEFLHQLRFNFFITDGMISVGEVAIGARINGEFKIASLTHIKDVNSEPTIMVLMPGDEVDITWNLIIARPTFLDGYEATKPDYLISKVDSYSDTVKYEIDYQMLTAYPNWHLMGLKRIMSLMAERNTLITKTTWNYQLFANSVWTVIDPTLEQLKSGNVKFGTDHTLSGYTVAKELYVPAILAPVKVSWNKSTSNFSESFLVKLTMEDLYARWEKLFTSKLNNKLPPQVVNILNVNYTTDAVNYNAVIQTTPYVIVTVYKNGTAFKNLLANEFGVCGFKVTRKGLLDTDVYQVKAHVNGYQLLQTVVFPTVTVEPNLLTADTSIKAGTDGISPHAIFFNVAPSLIGKTYMVKGSINMVAGVRTVFPDLNAPSATYGDISRVISFQGQFIIGDVITINLVDPNNFQILQTAQFEVKNLFTLDTRKQVQDVSEQLLLRVKAYDVEV